MSKNYIKVTFEARWANDHDVAHLQANELDLEWIGPVVVELQHPQGPDRLKDGQTESIL